jgi:hypothetical protein
MSDDRLDHCRVCGFEDGEPWGPDGSTPSFGICPCCGVEFGYEDITLDGVKDYRADWLSAGAKWFDERERPSDWSLALQLANIPGRFK